MRRAAAACGFVLVALMVGWLVWRWAGSLSKPEVETVRWMRAETVGQEGIRVVLYGSDYHSPSCWKPVPVVHYRSTEVGVVLRFERFSDFCTSEGGIQPTVDVELQQPLAGRAVVDDAA